MNSTDFKADTASIFDCLVRSRRSIRGFLEQPVEQELLEQVFDAASQAPSNCNTQPWQSHVVSGELCKRVSRRLLGTIGAGHHALDFPYDGRYEGVYRERQLAVAIQLYEALGVAREDRDGRHRAFLRNLEFFGAPQVVFIFVPQWCDVRAAADVGMYAQNLMLAMQSRGLASCPQTILGYDADSVRELLGIDAQMKLLFGISFGYEDTDLPENKIVPDRMPLSESVVFHS